VRALKAFIEPFILMLLGTVALASFLPAQGIWTGIFGFTANAAIVLLFFLHGAKLSRQAIIDGVRHWRLHLTTLSITFLLFPALGLGMARLHLLSGPLATGILFLSLLPSTVQSSIAFTAMARGNVAAAVCSASFSNLLGIVLTPLLVTLTIKTNGSTGVSWGAVQSILLQLLLPFILGHLLRPMIGAFVTRHKAMVTAVDRGSILLVVYTAFGAAVLEGLWHLVSAMDLVIIALACVVQLSIVLALTWTIGGALGFAREDRIVLLFAVRRKASLRAYQWQVCCFPQQALVLSSSR
jgi:sodium/bile acid cotransporter 7